MSGWENVKLSEVNPQQEPIPEGDYVFGLLGAAFDENVPGRINVSAVISNECEFTGRKLRFSYPDPEDYDWSPRVLKRLEIATGVDSLPGEGPVEFLIRAAENGARFGAPITKRTYKHRETGEDVTRSDINIFAVTAAA